MKLIINTTICILCCYLIYKPALPCTLEGSWSGVFKTDNGDEYPVTYFFKDINETLGGYSTFPKGALVNGKVVGDHMAFNIEVHGSLISHTAKIYCQADSIGMVMELNGKNLHVTLKRDK